MSQYQPNIILVLLIIYSKKNPKVAKIDEIIEMLLISEDIYREYYNYLKH